MANIEAQGGDPEIAEPQLDWRYRLSKSKIATFEHCPKRLWLQIHKREEGCVDADTRTRFAIGHQVGDLACSLHPDGIMVHADPDIGAALARTRELLAARIEVPIFESTFQREDVICRVDILTPDAGGGWHLAEVKSTTRVKAYQLFDLATQVWTIQASGIHLRSASIRHLERRFDPAVQQGAAGLFKDTPVLELLQRAVHNRSTVIAAARTTVRGGEPIRAMGAHCTFPFTCEFRDYCAR